MNAATLALSLALVVPRTTSASTEGLTLLEVVSQALVTNPEIQRQRVAVMTDRGAQGIAEGRFDWNLDAGIAHRSLHTPLTTEIERIDDVTELQVGMRKQFGWGTIIIPSVTLQRSNSVIPAVVTGTVAARNIAAVSLRIVQPLLRDIGGATSAERDAAELIVKASQHELQQVIATRVYLAASLYWNYLRATRVHEILQAAEARAAQILRDTKALVASEERPRADLEQLEANLADRMRSRIESSLLVAEARSELGIEMGLPYERIEGLPSPATPLPQALEHYRVATEPLIERALGQRQDLVGAGLRRSAMATLLGAAENQRLPQLDLTGEIGYAGVVGGSQISRFFQPLVDNVPGPNVQVSLLLRWPVLNSAADGGLLRAQAAARRAEIDQEVLTRRIGVNVQLSRRRLQTTLGALERARRAVVHYRAALDNEREKLRSGLSTTIIDVVLTEDLMTNALLIEVSAEASYAVAIARLAYEIGALTVPSDGSATIYPQRLTTPPSAP